MNMREEITRWMTEHVNEYTSAIYSAQAAIDQWDDEDIDEWVWDRAQEVFDLYNAKRMEDRYA